MEKMQSNLNRILAVALMLSGYLSGISGVPVAAALEVSPRTPATPKIRSDQEIASELSSLLSQLTAADTFSGAVLVAKDNRPIFREAYGLADKAHNLPNTVETKFNLGSMNKMFTGVAIAQLAERGKLSFTDTIDKYLPDYPDKTVASKVTIRQLLTHTSGMGDYLNQEFSVRQGSFKTATDYLPFIANSPLAFEPGQRFQYSNAGFVVLGAIVERVSGQNYYDYVREHIFRPAGMKDTGFYPVSGNLENSAIAYTSLGPKGPQPGPRQVAEREELKGGPAGGGYSTIDDMLKFSISLGAHKLLSARYTELVTTGKVDAPFGKYGYGFGDVNFNSVRSIGHNGGAPGIAAQFDIYPDLGYTVIVLSNYDPPAMIKVLSKIRTLIT
jgi:CubicO group peptidase (beta-lactamase class C family)